MRARILNLGVLAHVDAGKTSLTERLLFEHGTTTELGSVDAGTTQTDGNALERERGITIRSAVASFAVGDLHVNLIDTPGHPEFISEVQRSLSVLDGAVLVVSAVEGVQPQTRVLMRTLQSMQLPTIVVVNKIDRKGARTVELVDEIRRTLLIDVAVLNEVQTLGQRSASAHSKGFDTDVDLIAAIAEHDDALLAAFVDGRPLDPDAVRRSLAASTARGVICPLLFGSAMTGAGVADLTDTIASMLPTTPTNSDPTAELCGRVFAIERSLAGGKTAVIRLFGGQLEARQSLVFHRDSDVATIDYPAKVTQLQVVGASDGQNVARSGDIVRASGLAQTQIGDRLGDPVPRRAVRFAPPTLESVIRPRNNTEAATVHAALALLADEDPLIRIRAIPGGATSVFLYGDVQKEVIGDRLSRDFGLDVDFDTTVPLYLERVIGTGESMFEVDRRGENLFCATVGIRIEPIDEDGFDYQQASEWGVMPHAFHSAIEDGVYITMQQGLYGWDVIGCRVTVFAADQYAPLSTAADFRNLSPIVLLRALEQARTQVCEPCSRVEIATPKAALNAVLGYLSTIDAKIVDTIPNESEWVVHSIVPARLEQQLMKALPGLTHGTGVLWSEPARPRPVGDPVPTRARHDGNPLDVDKYLRHLSGRRDGA